ncbi:hypothetical protein DQQ10_09815 [Pseudochryseolinea flava]|uniref:DUF3179 domain-containing protein n=1 Tax=Pseudochryseolinea flava TaxID=2059302 RepID=A0A364Y6M9_9BACT|nr:hypothetical protein DQQ10_09815 [Pseudochryseolinea flava]
MLAIEIYRVYYIMPFTGSQDSDTLEIAYFIHQNIFYLRTVGIALILFPAWYYYSLGTVVSKVLISAAIVVVLVVAYFLNFKKVADRMFLQPTQKIFAAMDRNQISRDNLVLGVHINGESRAYPIELIGYHRQVRDSLGGQAIMVTYCTACRAGRVYSPEVDGVHENFRLVGMDHFNTMFEDGSTGSWWRQATGEAVIGSQKGKVLKEIPSAQMTLHAWFEKYPNTTVMQPDSTFTEQYALMKNYDEGKSQNYLTRRDSLSWKDKSWVVGVTVANHSRAYDWVELTRQRVINDTLRGLPIVVAIANDSASFYVWQRDTLNFSFDPIAKRLVDQSNSEWSWSGQCIKGPLQGKTLKSLQSYQEFWHSWKTFHPATTKHNSPN